MMFMAGGVVAGVVVAGRVVMAGGVVVAGGVVAGGVVNLWNDSGGVSEEAIRSHGMPDACTQGQSLLQPIDGGAELTSLTHVL
jgi:hypothetical protein